MNNKYFICAKYKNHKGELKEGFYANDRNSGGYAYFSDCITCPEVREFKNLEDAKKFLKNEYRLKDGKMEFYAYAGHDIIGSPYIVKTELKIETVYDTEEHNEVNKPDGNCLDCEFQYLEDSDYWCSVCPGNPEDI